MYAQIRYFSDVYLPSGNASMRRSRYFIHVLCVTANARVHKHNHYFNDCHIIFFFKAPGLKINYYLIIFSFSVCFSFMNHNDIHYRKCNDFNSWNNALSSMKDYFTIIIIIFDLIFMRVILPSGGKIYIYFYS